MSCFLVELWVYVFESFIYIYMIFTYNDVVVLFFLIFSFTHISNIVGQPVAYRDLGPYFHALFLGWLGAKLLSIVHCHFLGGSLCVLLMFFLVKETRISQDR